MGKADESPCPLELNCGVRQAGSTQASQKGHFCRQEAYIYIDIGYSYPGDIRVSSNSKGPLGVEQGECRGSLWGWSQRCILYCAHCRHLLWRRELWRGWIIAFPSKKQVTLRSKNPEPENRQVPSSPTPCNTKGLSRSFRAVVLQLLIYYPQHSLAPSCSWSGMLP